MKRILILSISLLFANLISSQTSWKNSVLVDAGCGMHSLLYSPANGSRSPGLGFMFEMQYHRLIISDFSLGAGVRFMSLSGKSTYNYSFTQSDVMLPGANYPASVTISFNEWLETQNFFQFSIPIEVYYHWTMKDVGFMAGVGAAVSLPLGNSYKTSDGTFSRTAYMDTLGVTFADLPNHGLGTFDSTYSGSLKGKINVALVFDVGADVYTTDKYKIYAGLYGSVALSPLYQSENNAMFDEKLAYHGAITSDQVDKVKYLTIGVKVGIVLGTSKKQTNNKQTNNKQTNKSTSVVKKDDDVDYNDRNVQRTIEESRNKAINRAKNRSEIEKNDINYDDPKVKQALEEAKKKALDRTKQSNN